MRKKLPSVWTPVSLILVELTLICLIITQSDIVINFIDGKRVLKIDDVGLAFILFLLICLVLIHFRKIRLFFQNKPRLHEKMIMNHLYELTAVFLIMLIGIFFFNVVLIFLEISNDIVRGVTLLSIASFLYLFSRRAFN